MFIVTEYAALTRSHQRLFHVIDIWIGCDRYLDWLNFYTRNIRGGQIEQQHDISNNVVCATSKGSVQPAHTRSLIRTFDCRLNIL